MSRRRTVIGFVAGALSAAVVAGGVAFAAIPSTANGTTTMCVNKSTGAARVIDAQAGKKCTTSERTISLRPGVGWKGTWQSGTTYRPGDLVRTADGATYLARTSSTGVAPASNTTAWARIASGPTPLPKAIGGAYNGFVSSTNSSSRTSTLAISAVPAGTYMFTGRFTVVGATTQSTRIVCGLGAFEDSGSSTSLDDGNIIDVTLPASAETGTRTNDALVSMVTLSSVGEVNLRCYTAKGDNGLSVWVRGALVPVNGATDIEPIHGI